MALLRDRSENVAVMTEINVTPFTDVLLVLLIIFMVLAAMVAPPGFQKELPNKCMPACGHSAATVSPVDFSVSRSGRIWIGGRATDESHIYVDLTAALKAHGVHKLWLIADAKAPYAAVMRVLDAAKYAHN